MDVFTEERQLEILKIMDLHGRVSVEELAKKFAVSEVTIRRDLKALSAAYPNIKRTYGGAIKKTHSIHGAFWHGGFESITTPGNTVVQATQEAKKEDQKEGATITFSRQTKGAQSVKAADYVNSIVDGERIPEIEMLKQENNARIAEFAVKFIEENDLISLEASDINILLANLIPANLKIKVFTNCPKITNILSQPLIAAEVYCSGGLLSKACNAFLDLKTVEFFNEFFTDKAFISLDAMDSNFTITTDNKEKSDIKKNIIKCAKEKIALCNSANLNKTLAFNAGNIKYVDALIVDRNIEKSFLEELKNANLRVYVV